MQTLLNADATHIPVVGGCFHSCITSPPYWGLRSYAGVEPTEWPAVTYAPMAGLPSVTVPAVTSCLGLEPTPEMYVAHLVLVFREVGRVLRDDGTCWIVIGDSYAGSGAGGGGNRKGNEHGQHDAMAEMGRPAVASGFKPKDLVGIPWRVALALQADGWWLRSDVIWAKPNPMPESTTDRPTKAHEYVFVLAKSQRYFWDQEAVKEEIISPGRSRDKGNGESAVDTKTRGHGSHCGTYEAGRNIRTVWSIPTAPYSGAKMQADYVGDNGKPYKVSPDCPIHGRPQLAQKFRMAECDELPMDYLPHNPDKDTGRVPAPLSSSSATTPRSPQAFVSESVSLQTPGSIEVCRSEVHHLEHIVGAQTPAHTNHKLEPDVLQDHSLDLPRLPYSPSATDHNTQSRKTDLVPQTSRHDTVCAQTPAHTEYTSPSRELSELDRDNALSNISASDCFDNHKTQMVHHTADKSPDKAVSLSFFAPPEEVYCTCKEVSSDHFACYPPALVTPMVRASTSERGCCPKCGAAWVQVVERERRTEPYEYQAIGIPGESNQKGRRTEPCGAGLTLGTIGFRPVCTCYNTTPWPSLPRKQRDETDDAYQQRTAPIRRRQARLMHVYEQLHTVPCRVLDPFIGSGTTLLVARQEGCDGVGLDMSHTYLHDQARVRLGLDALDAWENGTKTEDNSKIDDLPLFNLP